jgi:hypothetical protein
MLTVLPSAARRLYRSARYPFPSVLPVPNVIDAARAISSYGLQ